AGLGRGLQFELFRPATRERIAEFYAELPITVRVTGTYHDMGAFASDVAQLPRIVTLNDIGIVNDKGTLVMDATAKTFRYLDEDEIAKQRKSAKDAKAKTCRRDWPLVASPPSSSPPAAAKAIRTCAPGCRIRA